MIIDKTEGYLDKVREFADKIGMREQLEDKLDQLDMWFGKRLTANLYRDFAPHSFYWELLTDDGKRVMNGGLIFHGQHDQGGDGGAPTFSVCLEPTNGWSIHT